MKFQKKALGSLFLISTPWVLLYFLTTVVMDVSIFELIPIWSDELIYWHESYSLFVKGTEHGYYSINELIPNRLSFGTHGFGTISIYSLFAYLLGWNYFSIVIVNTILMSVSFLVVSYWINSSSIKTLLLAFFYLSFTPIILYSTTSMSELLNYSTLILYFSILTHYYKSNGNSQWPFLILIIFITLISCIRVINILLFLPIILIKFNGNLLHKKARLYLLIWIAFSLFLYKLTSVFTSPYPWSFLSELFNTDGILAFTKTLIGHFFINILKFLYPLTGDIIQVFQRYFFLLIVGLSLYKSRIIQTRFKKIELTHSIVFFVLFGFLTINLVAYDVGLWRDYRVLSPVLFGSIIFLFINGHYSFTNYAIGANLVFICLLLITPEVKALFFHKERYTNVRSLPLMELVNYSENFESKFVNTMVVNSFEKEIILNTPPGIGITYTKEITDHLQSNYLMVDQYFDLLTYEVIGRTQSHILYRKKKPQKD